ncbi:MAG TPA: tripartite tricarboxylate transporter substrate binding protein [Burkholderiales bacterium]|jgi:tripartite-type tricarboxylate transporter receptor subunit TctC|nr:tripartite tricarboxylate transporter substrate binding protein [Burkholderiales bacterium]
MRKLLAALLVAVPCFASAQSYPAKPVRIIVPFPPGGTTDLIARIVQPRFQEFMGQTVLIENRSGAGGSVGAAEVARAPADGYTLLMVFDTHAVNHHIFKMAPDPFKQLEHICLMVRSPSALVGVTSFAPNNLREVVAYAKANPEKVTYSTPGSGSSNHLAALLLEQVAGIKMTHVAYKGGGPMIQALLSQQVHISFFSLPLMVPHIKAGKMKGLAVGSRARVPQLPDVQTLSETFPGFEQYSWFGILGPAGLPKDVAAKVHRETVRTLQAPDVNGKLTEQGFEIVASSPEEFVKFVQGESDKLGRLIRDNKIVAE